jgi:uncharacterized protein (DUF488 family)
MMWGMWTDSGGLIGIGYQGLTLDNLSDKLSKWGVTVLVDVRLNAVSRKPGFSKGRLSAHLEERGIRYVHMPALGNPKDNRAGYGGDAEAIETSRGRFRAVLDGDGAREALRELVDLAGGAHVAVFCYEESELHCHRNEVLFEANRLMDTAPAGSR